MKKLLSLFLLIMCILTFSGCSRFEVHGLENFSENTCSLGLNDGLLPGDRQFLSDYTCEEGDYHYLYDDNIKHIKAKTFVQLQYSEKVYQQAKSVCEGYYTLAAEPYNYGNYVFSAPNPLLESNKYSFRGMQMFGYNDNNHTLIFIGAYGYEFDQSKAITASAFTDFISHEFGEYIISEIDSLS